MPATQPLNHFDDETLRAFEQAAVEAVTQAGKFAFSRFMGPMKVESKSSKPGRDLVTDVDRESQRIIASIMADRCPGHQLLGEEDQQSDPPAAADTIWAVDPIDGTANYVNKSSTHAVSVGVMHRGIPIAGAVWTPWPWPEGGNGGAVMHARRGGGAKWMRKQVCVAEPIDELGRPVSGRLSILPGNARSVFRFSRAMRGHAGDVRVTGSASYEMAHVASGMYQYGIMGTAAVWDFAAATIIVEEAGGEVLSLDPHTSSWKPFAGWGAPYANDSNTFKKMRDWRGIVLAAHPRTASFLSQNIIPRQRGIFSYISRQVLGIRSI